MILRRWLQHLGAPIDGRSLVAFRVGFGLLMLASVVRTLGNGWVRELYLEPRFFFTYPGLEWIRPWPAPWMYAHFVALGVLAVLIALGRFYRVSMALFFIGFTYVELIDQTNYLNHYYLISILALLMTFMPLDRRQVPRWCLWTLRLQVGLVYFFAGVAKIRPDWLLEGQPLAIWLAARADVPIIGPLCALPNAALVASWLGLLFDLGFPLAMLGKRTRPYAFAVGLVFHAVTGMLFSLGMFPWIMIGCATLFFPADWPARFGLSRASVALPARPLPILAAALLVGHFAVQAVVPLRKHLHPGDAAWTENGFRFAWHVMVMEKAGATRFSVRDATGKRWIVVPDDYLTPRQLKMMSTSPEMIAQLGRHIAADFRSRGYPHVEVTAEAYVSLNGRRSSLIMDPRMDLASAR